MGSVNIYKTRFRWSTQIKDVVDFETFYRVTVKAENINEPGSLEQIKIGYFLEDNLGNRYIISGVNIDGYIGVITVIDDFKYRFGPRLGEGVVYESVDLGDAPLIGPTKYENLDVSALSRALGIDMDIIWRNLYHYWRLSSEKIEYGYLYNWFALNKTAGGNKYGYLYNAFALERSGTSTKQVNYGYLYNWYTVNNGSGSNPPCTAKAHVPSNTEWETLRYYLSAIDPYNEGNLLKETGIVHWNSPNAGALDAFGFSAIAAGYRNDGYYNIGGENIFLSKTQVGDGTFYCMLLDSGTYLNNYYPPLYWGTSMRLIIDIPDTDNGDGTGTYIGVNGQVYDWITIGGQRWTKQNLIETKYQDESDIPEVTDQLEWEALTAGARCSYDNDSSLAYTEIFSYLIAAPNAHVPSVSEWQDLSSFLGGDPVSGGHLKETGLLHWDSPNDSNSDNSSGFNAQGSGVRRQDGTFWRLNKLGKFRTSDPNTYYGLLCEDMTLSTFTPDDLEGLSIRLVIDSPVEISGANAIYVGNDHKRYPCVLINGIWWLAENLRETKYNTGASIPEISNDLTWSGQTLGARCSYNNDPTLAYNDLITTTISAYNAHVPSGDEWTALQEVITALYPGSEGGALKEAGTDHWQYPNTGAMDYFGFKALPGGSRITSGEYTNMSSLGLYWSLAELDSTSAYYLEMDYSSELLNYYTDLKNLGCSLRLIVDSPNIINPDLVTGQYFGNDSQVYECALMPDGKWWMIENLCESKYNDGSPIQEIVDSTEWSALTIGARCSYDNNPINAFVPKLRVFSKDFVNFVDSETVTWIKTRVSSDEIQITATAAFDYSPYVLPIATTVAGGNILGGIRVGSNLSINPATGVLSSLYPMVYPAGTGLAFVSGGNSWGATVTIGSGLNLDASTHVLTATSSGGMIWPGSAGVAYYAGSSAWGSLTIGAGLALTGSGGVMTLAATGSGGSMVYPGAGIALSSGSSWGTSLTVGSGLIVASNAIQTAYPSAGIVNSSGSAWGTVTIGSGLSYVDGTLSATSGSGIMVYPASTGLAWVNSGTSWGTTITIGSGLTILGSVLSASSMVWPPTTIAGLAYYNGASAWNTSLTIGSGLAIVGGALTATGGASMVYPPTGLPTSTGSGWGSSFSMASGVITFTGYKLAANDFILN